MLDRLQFFFQRLLLIKVGVIAAARHQFRVRALFRDCPSRGPRCGRPAARSTRGAKSGSSCGRASPAAGGQNALLGQGIDARRASSRIRIARIPQHRAGNRGPLLLPAGERDAALARPWCRSPSGKLRYRSQVRRSRRRGGSAPRVAASTPKAMFSRERGAEQERLLRNEANLPAQIGRVDARAGRCRRAAPRPPSGPSAAESD